MVQELRQGRLTSILLVENPKCIDQLICGLLGLKALGKDGQHVALLHGALPVCIKQLLPPCPRLLAKRHSGRKEGGRGTLPHNWKRRHWTSYRQVLLLLLFREVALHRLEDGDEVVGRNLAFLLLVERVKSLVEVGHRLVGQEVSLAKQVGLRSARRPGAVSGAHTRRRCVFRDCCQASAVRPRAISVPRSSAHALQRAPRASSPVNFARRAWAITMSTTAVSEKENPIRGAQHPE